MIWFRLKLIIISKSIQCKLNIYPWEDGEEGEEDGADDVWAGKAEHLIALAPRVTHVAENDKKHKTPEPGECHVKNDKVLPGLDGRHLLEKPEKDGSLCYSKIIFFVSERDKLQGR